MSCNDHISSLELKLASRGGLGSKMDTSFVDFDGFISIFMETVLELTNVVFLCFSFSFPEKGMKCGHF